MVIRVEPGLLQPAGLIGRQHAERAAGLQPERLDPADHLQHPIERRAVRTSRQAAPMQNRVAPSSLRLAGRGEHGIDVASGPGRRRRSDSVPTGGNSRNLPGQPPVLTESRTQTWTAPGS